MKKLSMSLIVFFALLMAFASCNKDEKGGGMGDVGLLEQFFERNMVPTQSFTVDAGAGGVINTAAGTRITFPPNALVTAGGQPVTGTVNVEFKEINDKADFVLSNKPTISDGLPLESGGTWLLEVRQNGQLLRIKQGIPPINGVRLNIKRDTAIQGDMFLFNAVPKGNNTAALNWGRPRQPIIPLAVPFSNYFCNLDSVGWGNADRFLTNPDYAFNVTVTANNGTANLSNFSGMFIYKGYKIVWPLQKDGQIFRDSHIAKGQKGHFAVFGFVNGVFTAGILTDKTIISNGDTFDVLLNITSEASFKATLKQVLQ